MTRRKAGSDRLDAIGNREPVLAPDFARIESEPSVERRPPMLPQPCPVTPLGVNGKNIIFLDGLNQVVDTAPRAEKGDLKLWFGNAYLLDEFPQKPAKWKDGDPITKFDQDDVQTALVEDCRALGIFNPNGRVFGRGAHRLPDDDAVLALHLGDRVMLINAPDAKGKRQKKPQIERPGRMVRPGGRDAFFPAMERLPGPADVASSAQDALDLLTMIQTRWYWTEPRASALILLGHIVQMFFCGWLDWRAHIWLAAPTASGKTTLQKLIRAIHDDWCLYTEDASEAALRQVLMDDTLPVMIDEAEAHDKPEKLANILNLIKKSSSGARIYRGSQDHKATGFTAQSCFLLSSVLHANMRGEDRNRIAILEMRAVPEDAEPLELERATWAALGKKMRKRVIDQWPRFEKTLQAYKREISKQGFSGRWGDTYGTFLACADLVLYDHAVNDIVLDAPGIERVAELVRDVTPAMRRGRSEARSDVDRIVVYLASHILPGAAGQPGQAISWWIEKAMTLKRVPGQFITEHATSPDSLEIDDEARRKLKTHGLRVVNAEDRGAGRQPGITDAIPGEHEWNRAWLAVAYNTNKPLCEVFRNSEWADGIWLQSLGKIPNVMKGVKICFSGPADNAILVPLSIFRAVD